MSETNVQNVDSNTMFDLFPDLGTNSVGGKKPSFGMVDDINTVDLFNTGQQNQTPVAVSKAAETTTGQQADTQTQTQTQTAEPEKPTTEVDILGDGVQQTQTSQGAPIADLSGYYQDRIKSGKFVAIDQEDDKGNLVPFIPKTAEEYDEVLELQIDYRLNEAKKDLEKTWYASKSPAWKAISQYAELVDDPTQLIPFLQGVRTMTSIANLDENTPDGAEQIIRTRMSQGGDPEEIISQQIESLKTTDNLVKTAKAYKPLMLQQEQTHLQHEMKARQEQEKQYQQLVSEIRNNAIKSIEAPLFGKTKLKNEEKAAIYDLIAEPAEETQGYGIYNVIDSLFEKKDFDKLKEVALFLSNREAFMNYLGINVANQTAAQLERKLRLAGEGRTTAGRDQNDDQQQTQQNRVQRNQFKSKPTFGGYNK